MTNEQVVSQPEIEQTVEHQKRPGFLRSHPEYPVCVFLLAITLAVYSRVVHYDFVLYDDDFYVTRNPIVQIGLHRATVIWALGSTYIANWHPLTWITYFADYDRYGLEAGGYHQTNLILHLANVLLLFFVLRRMTGSVRRSAFVAALFAVHPLHVESVAWIAERKDVLSTFFWLLTMWAYVRYTEHPRLAWRLLTLGFFMLGLMSKSMLVSLPFVLLLMDYWPLRRIGSASNDGSAVPLTDLIREKVPLFGAAAFASLITYYAQQHGGSFSSAEVYPLPVRISNAAVAYVKYIAHMLYPRDLSVLYMHPGRHLPIWEVLCAGALVISATACAIAVRRSKPYLFVGWFWYLVTLLPVIGLVQVGIQAMADRYTYMPLTGLFMAMTWGIPGLLGRRIMRYSTVLACAVVLVLMALAWRQVGYWQDSITLFEHAVKATPTNQVMHCNLGLAYVTDNRLDEAIVEYRKAVKLTPDFSQAHNNLAVALGLEGRYAEAWKEAHLAERWGTKPDPGFLSMLRTHMAEPGE